MDDRTCQHSAQDWYIETATGRRGCNECDSARMPSETREALRLIVDFHEECFVRGVPLPVNTTKLQEAYSLAKRLLSRPQSPADPSETLALIAKHRMDLAWTGDGRVRALGRRPGPYVVTGDLCPTIGDAVRACVARIKEAK